ncbi:MAG: RagB/SusD family nutrient uptake outer membrane protein [Carboxylicivirga sp.]|jgi:hypothetical protein|nr:RagB/SusD family nutrient uptake outer membrane protein [Carboxylicivirga sp.]
MKLKYISLVLACLTLMACNDEFLEQVPQDELSLATPWTQNLMEQYSNEYYKVVKGHTTGWGFGKAKSYIYEDEQSDNMARASVDLVAAGLHSVPDKDGGWGQTSDWEQLRRCNFFLEGVVNSPESDTIKNHYAGLAKFWRAWFYFKKVKRFGDVTFFTKAVTIADEAILFGPRTPRNDVMDSVLVDLNFACRYIHNGNVRANDYINRYTALALKARICLHEGTFRKYHGLEGSDLYLKEARDAAFEIMESGKYNLYRAGDEPYNDLFKQEDMLGIEELIFIKRYQTGVHGHSRLRYRNGDTGLTKDMVDDYLNADGSFYDGSKDDDIAQELADRDPRLLQTIYWKPDGGVWTYSETPATWPVPLLSGAKFDGKAIQKWNLTTTGYHLSLSFDATYFNASNMDAPILRYAEVLLVYAEACAELGECTQDVVDRTINQLRDRVGMADMNVAGLIAEPADRNDYARYYPEKRPEVLLEEIRRERRVELACQGFRYDDLMRWKVGKFMTKPVRGMRVSAGTPNEAYITAITKVDANGFVAPYLNTEGETSRNFDENKHYLFPIPLESKSENPALGQNPGWE